MKKAIKSFVGLRVMSLDAVATGATLTSNNAHVVSSRKARNEDISAPVTQRIRQNDLMLH